MISIIIKVYNAEDTLSEALDSLVPQCCGCECEILLSDNGSTDATREIFTEYAKRFPSIPMRVVDASQRRGRSYALNVGIREARGDNLLFLDADDTVAPGWLDAMSRALASAPLVAARMDATPLNPGWIHASRRNSQEHGLDTLTQEPFCVHAAGGTMGFHRRVFEAVGDFDETLDCLEDTDFCIRAYLKGFRIAFVPNAVCNYRYRDTLEGIQSQARDYAQYLTLLRKRYAKKSSFFAPRAWLSLGLEFVHLGAEAAGAARHTPLDAARFQQRLGAAKGELIGALTYRVAPRWRRVGGRRDFGGLLRRLRHAGQKAPDSTFGRAGGGEKPILPPETKSDTDCVRDRPGNEIQRPQT